MKFLSVFFLFLISPAVFCLSYDSGWTAENSTVSHTTIFNHGLSTLPTRVSMWFATAEVPVRAYPKIWPWGYSYGGNPVSISCSSSDIRLNIVSGSALHSYWYHSPSAWTNWNSGFIRVTADNKTPDFDSGWIYDTNSTSHITEIPHSLGAVPSCVSYFFSPDTVTAYPLIWYWHWSYTGNPVSVDITETSINFHIYSGVYLFGYWVPNSWTYKTSGYWRVCLWK